MIFPPQLVRISISPKKMDGPGPWIFNFEICWFWIWVTENHYFNILKTHESIDKTSNWKKKTYFFQNVDILLILDNFGILCKVWLAKIKKWKTCSLALYMNFELENPWFFVFEQTVISWWFAFSKKMKNKFQKVC